MVLSQGLIFHSPRLCSLEQVPSLEGNLALVDVAELKDVTNTSSQDLASFALGERGVKAHFQVSIEGNGSTSSITLLPGTASLRSNYRQTLITGKITIMLENLDECYQVS